MRTPVRAAAPRTPRRWAALVLLAVAALLVVGSPSPAQAHARPVGTYPADNEVVPEAPTELSVTFNEPVTLAAAGNQVLGPDGAEVASSFSVRDRVLTISLEEALPDGTHVVTWRVTSSDSHPVAGAWTFAVGAPSAHAPAVPVVTEQRDVRLAQAIATGVQYAGLLGLAGVVGVATLLAPVAVRRDAVLARRWHRAAGGFAALAALGSTLLAPLSALRALGEPLGAWWSADTWSEAVRGASATTAAVVVVGVLATVAALRRGLDVLAAAAAATALAAMVLVGHTRSSGPAAVVLGADLVHLGAAALWWGGLVALGLALAPGTGLRPAARAVLVARFSGAAAVSVLGLVAAGLVLYWQVAHSVGGLWETGYGRTVLLKVALVLPVVALAGWNRYRLLPRLGTGPREDPAGAEGRLRTVVRCEAGVLVAVVAATGVLVNLTPPARSATEPPPLAAERAVTVDVGGGLSADMTLAPGRPGVNGVRLRVTDADGRPVELAGPPTLTLLQPEREVGPLRRPVTPSASGTWEATADLPVTGTWEVTLAVPLSRFEEPVVIGRIEVQ
ncbi:copper resistance CopC/CopD family protein [Nocardioides sp. J54]|uniref:copper resistance CopC/CopD family protein n=1 Tax=Nocardioides sp. J54 TaxID=935866 RepID=UPI0018DCDF91|nr:FixH family protein [Nocardioides sp. J54]